MEESGVKIKGGVPYEYDAGGTYKKILEKERGPRNIPANIMNRLQAQLIGVIQHDPRLKASALAMHVGEVDAYQQMDRESRSEYARTCNIETLLVALKVVEEDVDILDVINAKRRLLADQEEKRLARKAAKLAQKAETVEGA